MAKPTRQARKGETETEAARTISLIKSNAAFDVPTENVSRQKLRFGIRMPISWARLDAPSVRDGLTRLNPRSGQRAMRGKHVSWAGSSGSSGPTFLPYLLPTNTPTIHAPASWCNSHTLSVLDAILLQCWNNHATSRFETSFCLWAKK